MSLSAVKPSGPPPECRLIAWSRTLDTHFPFLATVEGECWRLRINDFPDEPLYTLFVGQEQVQHVEDFPVSWSRPKSPEFVEPALRRLIEFLVRGDYSQLISTC